MTKTIGDVLAERDIPVPDETIAALEVPVLAGPQRQGDVMIVPWATASAAHQERFTAVPPTGVAVVEGEATGNSHILHPEPGATAWWRPYGGTGADALVLGVLVVEDGPCWLVHTDEHGVNGIAPGTYVLRGKREQRDEIQRVAD